MIYLFDNVNNIVTIEEKTETIEEDFPYVKHEAYIAGWGIATPFPVTTERFLEIDKQQRTALGQPQKTIDLMASLINASKINHRHSCHPFFLPKDKSPSDYPDAIGTASEDMFKDNINPPHYKRLSFFQETALKLCVSAAERAIEKWGQDKMLISHILSTCTSGFVEPGIPCAIIKELGLSQDIQKAELNYNGCFCGATCLRLARDLIRAGDATAVLVVACETATSHVDWNNVSLEGLVAVSLFADGAAAMIIAREGVWKYKTTGSSIVPESSHLLGLRPPHAENETTYMMTLSKNVAPALRDYFSNGHGVKILKKLYNPDEPRPALAVHPGGPRILEAVGEVLIKQGWKEDALQASYDTFGYYGNLGSAAMVVVLAHRLTKNDIEEDKLITMAFGPGVTVEYAQLERATQENSYAAEVARVKRKFGIPVTTA